MRRRHLVLALAAVVVAAVSAGWLRALPAGASAAAGDEARWRIPDNAVLERSSATLDATARSLRWVGGGQDGGQADRNVQWTLLGVMPRENAVLVRAGTDEAITRLEVGETLPDGARLTSVSRDTAMIERDGCRTARPLYPRPTVDTAGHDCIDDGSPKETTSP